MQLTPKKSARAKFTSNVRALLAKIEARPELEDVPTWGRLAEHTGEPVKTCRAMAKIVAGPNVTDDVALRLIYALEIRKAERRACEHLRALARGRVKPEALPSWEVLAARAELSVPEAKRAAHEAHIETFGFEPFTDGDARIALDWRLMSSERAA